LRAEYDEKRKKRMFLEDKKIIKKKIRD